jgi:hypothetical protein
MVSRTKDINVKEPPLSPLIPDIHTLARWPEACLGTFKNSSNAPSYLRQCYHTPESFNSLPLLVFWTLSIVQFLFKNNVSETGFCLRPQVKASGDRD